MKRRKCNLIRNHKSRRKTPLNRDQITVCIGFRAIIPDIHFIIRFGVQPVSGNIRKFPAKTGPGIQCFLTGGLSGSRYDADTISRHIAFRLVSGKFNFPPDQVIKTRISGRGNFRSRHCAVRLVICRNTPKALRKTKIRDTQK